MPQIAALTIGTDTYKPFSRVSDGVVFNNTVDSPSVAVAPTLISQTIAPKNPQDGMYRVKVNINLPVTCESADACLDVSVKNIVRAKVEFIIPATSNVTNREKILTLVKDALANGALSDTIVDLESFYG